jgi:hypothetical protein
MKAADKDDCKAMPKDGMVDKDVVTDKKKMPFKGKKGDVAAEKADVSDDDDDGDEDKDQMEKKTSKKSLVTADTLSKSLDLLQSFAQAELEKSDTGARKASLLQKAMQGDLTDEENDDLYRLNSGQKEPQDDTLAERVERSMQPEGDLSKSHDSEPQGADVSAYLEGFRDQITKSLALVAQEVEGYAKRQHAFNLLNAKASVQTGTVIKGLADTLGIYKSTQARAPKSMGLTGAAPMAKSFGGQAPAGALQGMSKGQVCKALTAMYSESLTKGLPGNLEGFDLAKDIAVFEMSDELHPTLQAEVHKFVKRNQAGA